MPAHFLQDKQNLLTKAQKQALKYILDHREEAVFLTATLLSGKAGVSEATVVRLAQVLGFSGYAALQKRLREDFRDRLSTVSRLKASVRKAGEEGDILTKVVQEDIRNLTDTLRDISVESFHQAVSDIRSAGRVYAAGLRGANAPAVILSLYLRFLKKDARLLVPGSGDVWNNLIDIGPEDLVIGISLPRYTRVTVEILEYARAKGARVGAITDSLLSPLAPLSDWVLTVHSRLDSYIESFTAIVSLVNALLTAVSVQSPEETLKALEEREALWEAKKIYVSLPDEHPKMSFIRTHAEEQASRPKNGGENPPGSRK
jgi:DNA-binding MurR/RpiR family transcriptional regulator